MTINCLLEALVLMMDSCLWGLLWTAVSGAYGGQLFLGLMLDSCLWDAGYTAVCEDVCWTNMSEAYNGQLSVGLIDFLCIHRKLF